MLSHSLVLGCMHVMCVAFVCRRLSGVLRDFVHGCVGRLVGVFGQRE